MLDLQRLNVSLTKHGAHKIASLLKKYDKDAILRRLDGAEPGINIEGAQARKNLSVTRDGHVPDVWNKARLSGSESIGALVLIAIIFSHHALIEAMRAGRRSPFRGVIERGAVIDDKAFTNFAHTIEELGYSVSHTPERVAYNLTRLFEIPGFHKLAVELIKIKLLEAGWDRKGPFLREFVRLNLNEVFSISRDQLVNWIATGDIDEAGDVLEDNEFFLDINSDNSRHGPFLFRPGHNPKKTGSIDIVRSKKRGKAELIHNKLQTALYMRLIEVYGPDAVGTEIDSGYGTSIDLAVKTDQFCWLYEIKVAKSLKACIRQAVPQLLEYAYWRDDNNIADKLYIATRFNLTKDASRFLGLLRDRFDLPLFYEQISEG